MREQVRRFFQEIDGESIEPDGGRVPTVVVLCTAAVSLTLLKYFGTSDRFYDLVGHAGPATGGLRLAGYVYWSCFCGLAYVGIPYATMRAFGLGGLRDVGVRWTGFREHVHVYALMLVPVLLAVLAASHLAKFQAVYPFYKPEPEDAWRLLLYEVFYGLQFLYLEFFFRGYLLHVPKRRLGVLAVFVMMVPYCMLHFTKPVQEAVGAILGGTALGLISLRTRSIFGGCMLHLAVAWSMDFLSLYHQGKIPQLLAHLAR